MNLKGILMVCAVILSCLLTSNAHAGSEKDFNRKEKRAHKIFRQLDLTDEQKKQLEENRQKHKAETKTLFEQKKSYREDLKKEIMQADVDMDKINGIQSQLKTVQAQMLDSRLSSVLEVRRILTSEQFGKFISLMEKQKPGLFSKKENGF